MFYLKLGRNLWWRIVQELDRYETLFQGQWSSHWAVLIICLTYWGMWSDYAQRWVTKCKSVYLSPMELLRNGKLIRSSRSSWRRRRDHSPPNLIILRTIKNFSSDVNRQLEQSGSILYFIITDIFILNHSLQNV